MRPPAEEELEDAFFSSQQSPTLLVEEKRFAHCHSTRLTCSRGLQPRVARASVRGCIATAVQLLFELFSKEVDRKLRLPNDTPKHSYGNFSGAKRDRRVGSGFGVPVLLVATLAHIHDKSLIEKDFFYFSGL